MQDPDELLTRLRRAMADAQRQMSQGNAGPALGFYQTVGVAFENLDAYLQMGGRLPSSWKRARPAGAPRPVDRAATGTSAQCGAPQTDGPRPTLCTRLRGHHGVHKHEPTGIAWK